MKRRVVRVNTARGTRRVTRFRALALCVLLGAPGFAAGTTVASEMEILVRVGPWPVLSRPIGYRGRLWMAGSVKGRNHNSADLFSYDPVSGRVRYERHLFSQDAGAPLVSGGLLYWPFEDSRFSIGWGQFLVTNGDDWRMGTIPSARIFHTHAMAEAGGRILAATSAWRAGLQGTDDGGRTWRALYGHPTPERRVSRIVELAVLDDRVFGTLIESGRSRLVRIDGDRLAEVPGWPRDRPIHGLAPFHGWLYGLVNKGDEVALWRANEERSERIGAPRDGWQAHALAVGADGLWAAGAERDGGTLWCSEDGIAWEPYAELKGGTPRDITIFGGRPYVTGAGNDGRGILWGPAPPAPVGAAAGHEDHDIDTAPSVRRRAAADWTTASRALDRALADPRNYERHGRVLRDLVYRHALAGPPPNFFSDRLSLPTPDRVVSLIGGAVKVPARDLGRWILLWGIAVAGSGRVPPELISLPWSAPPNPSEKYFETAPAAMWAAAQIGQNDRATIDALIGRLGRPGDPPWLRGDVIGALTALTGQRFGFDVAAWRGWWRRAGETWRTRSSAPDR